jgi:hypothetical protein
MKELKDQIKQIDRSIAELKRQKKRIEWQIEQIELAAINQLKIDYENIK